MMRNGNPACCAFSAMVWSTSMCRTLQRLLMHALMGRGDEALEERVRLVWFAVELRVKLTRDKERVLRQLDDLDQFAIWSKTAEHKACFLKTLAISVVELITMTMTFVHHKGAVKPRGSCSDHELARLRAESHGASLFGDSGLLVQHGDDRVGCGGIELGGVSFLEFQHVPGKFYRGGLHSQT